MIVERQLREEVPRSREGKLDIAMRMQLDNNENDILFRRLLDGNTRGTNANNQSYFQRFPFSDEDMCDWY